MFILELSCFILINQVAGPYMGTRQCSSSCLKEVFERVVDEINNQKQDLVIRAVRKMKERAQACVAVGGGVFEGRKL